MGRPRSLKDTQMKTEQPSRRGFFKAVAISGATVAAAVATTMVGRKAVTNTATAVDSTQTGYRETAHIRHYYRTTQV